MTTVYFHVFGEIYPIPLNTIKDSYVVESLYDINGDMISDVIRLDFDPIYKLAFLFLYNCLISQCPQYPTLETVIDALKVRDYLGLDFDLSSELEGIAQRIPKYGENMIRYIYDKYPMFIHHLIPRKAVSLTLAKIYPSSQWSNISLKYSTTVQRGLPEQSGGNDPNWIRDTIEQFYIQDDFSSLTNPIFVKLEDYHPNVTSILETNTPHLYGRRCQRSYQPDIIDISSVSSLIDNKVVRSRLDINNKPVYYSCTNPNYPYMYPLQAGLPGGNQYIGMPCSKRTQENTFASLPQELFNNKKLLYTTGNFAVIVDQNYDERNEIIYVPNYRKVDELNALLVL